MVDLRTWSECGGIRLQTNDVQWHPTNEFVLSTAGVDANVCEWDLRKLRCPTRTFMQRVTEVHFPDFDKVQKKRKIEKLPEIFRLEIAKMRPTGTTTYRGALPTCEHLPVKLAYTPSGARLLIRTFRHIVPIDTRLGMEEPHSWSEISESYEVSHSAQLLISHDEESVFTSTGDRLEVHSSEGKVRQKVQALVGDVRGMCYSQSYESLYVGEADGLVSRWESCIGV